MICIDHAFLNSHCGFEWCSPVSWADAAKLPHCSVPKKFLSFPKSFLKYKIHVELVLIVFNFQEPPDYLFQSVFYIAED
ncbi:hypothetical protein SLEP1_g60043 [Rubroshorea leprosula]|uniref:Uncharacterized protein n=1 Tax=Rubroshorea leprosula TaxID=152421 RepID=A0AAV5MYQ6_9ROSI|nr:hypothetical protein SLEP1_g60043 [Rubroshorea leprosula]